MIAIAKEVETDPQLVRMRRTARTSASTEVTAARKPGCAMATK